jgi:hypothetical protein
VSEVVYARVPAALKQLLVARARERGLSLTGAVVELLERGLEANTGADCSLAEARSALATTRSRLVELELSLELAAAREQTDAGTLAALAERSRQALAQCPRCREPVSGSDFLVRGHCPHCGKELTALLMPRPQPGAPEREEYMALLGALGVLVGLSAARSPEPRVRESQTGS